MQLWQKLRNLSRLSRHRLNRWMMTDRGEERRRNLRESLSIDSIILFFMGGIILFYGFADFEKPLWSYMYYVWNKSEDTVGFACIWTLAPKKYKSLILPVLVFCVIRMAWEILALLLGQDVNSIMILDYLFVLTIVILIWKYLVRWLEYR